MGVWGRVEILRKNRKLGSIRGGKDVEDKNVLRKISRIHFLYSWCLPNCLCNFHLGNWLNPTTKYNIIHSFKNGGYAINLKMFPNLQQMSGPKQHFCFLETRKYHFHIEWNHSAFLLHFQLRVPEIKHCFIPDSRVSQCGWCWLGDDVLKLTQKTVPLFDGYL